MAYALVNYIQIHRVKPTSINGGFHLQNRFTYSLSEEDSLNVDLILKQLSVLSSRDIVAAGQTNLPIMSQLFEIAKGAGVHGEAVPDAPYQIRYLRVSNDSLILGVEFLD